MRMWPPLLVGDTTGFKTLVSTVIYLLVVAYTVLVYMGKNSVFFCCRLPSSVVYVLLICHQGSHLVMITTVPSCSDNQCEMRSDTRSTLYVEVLLQDLVIDGHH